MSFRVKAKIVSKEVTTGIRYHVEWCSEIPKDDVGDSDMDSAKYLAKCFTRIDTAIQFAKEILPSDQFGCVRIEEQEYRFDEDTFKYEGWKRYTWEPLRYMHVDDADAVYGEKDLNTEMY